MAWFFESQATTTIVVTRYADSVQDGDTLSPPGERRAEELARILSDVDVVAGIVFLCSLGLLKKEKENTDAQ